MAKRKTILILTGGGLAATLNATLYGAITRARLLGYKILGGLNGWVSLVQRGKIVDLTNLPIEAIKSRGGNLLRSSRTNPFKVQNGLRLLKEKIKRHELAGLLAIGGNDTLSAAARLYLEEKIPIVGLPKTVDNDLPITYFSPGFPSAAFYAARLAAETKEDSAYNLNRVYIIEMYGAKAGWLTCAAALGGADLIIPPEWEFNLTNILKMVKEKYEQNGNYCLVALSKEARIKGLKAIPDSQPDGFKHVRQELISLSLKEKIENCLGLSARIIVPMNYFQSGPPTKLDQSLALKLGQKGVDLIKEGQFGQTAVIAYQNKKLIIKTSPLKNFLKETISMNASWFNKKALQPTKKYLNYLKITLPDQQFTDLAYLRLQKIICRKS